jgi:hypothetical protein
MKKSLVILFLFIGLFCGNVAAQQTCTPTNRALLVAIDQYPEKSGWSDIHATNDIQIIQPMLLQNGYKPENIQVLLNEAATKSAILKALDKLCALSHSGDYVYIHFSCHGQNMTDNNGDEPDGLDEALIPYDARYRYSKGIYEGENHLRDDDLEKQLDKIRKKTGTSGNLIVLLDACHSGTGSRDGDDEEYIRGTSYIFGAENTGGKNTINRTTTFSHKKGKNLSPITVFCACLPEEVNYEYRDNNRQYYGALSYAFCEMIKTASATLTHRQFAATLQTKINILFANRKRKQTPYFETTDEQRIFQIGR